VVASLGYATIFISEGLFSSLMSDIEIRDALVCDGLRVGGLTLWTRPCHASPAEQVLDALASAKGYDLLVTPEYAFTGTLPGLAVDECRNIQAEIARMSRGTLFVANFLYQDNGMLRNETIACAGGDVLHTYGKKMTADEGRLAKKAGLSWLPGNASGAFAWNGLKVGIEVCIDAGVLASEGVTDCDLLLSPCCGSWLFNTDCVKPGGSYVMVDGSPAYMLSGIVASRGAGGPVSDMGAF